jgi:hypothetical protein
MSCGPGPQLRCARGSCAPRVCARAHTHPRTETPAAGAHAAWAAALPPPRPVVGPLLPPAERSPVPPTTGVPGFGLGRLDLTTVPKKQKKSALFHTYVGLVVRSCSSHPGILRSIPKREEPGKTGRHPVLKYRVPHGSHFTAAGMPSQCNQSESFQFKRAAFYQGLKSKVGLAADKTAALRINLNVQGCSIIADPMHAPSRTSLLLPSPPSSHNLPLPRVH